MSTTATYTLDTPYYDGPLIQINGFRARPFIARDEMGDTDLVIVVPFGTHRIASEALARIVEKFALEADDE